jgi:hypothetical protein
MKKLISILALTAAFAVQANAQSMDTPPSKPQMVKRQNVLVQPAYNQALGPIQGEIGLATDPDPNVRLDLHRNFEHYAHGTGG